MKATVWCLSDLHLPSTKNRTMDQYDPIWVDHMSKIYQNVTAKCKPEDILLIPGDISWASNIKEAKPDFDFIGSLPCRVIMSPGNHEQWAKKYNDVLKIMPANGTWAERGCIRIGQLAIVSCRLWDMPDCFPWPGHFPTQTPDVEKLQRRERLRLEEALKRLPQDNDLIRILMVHFPPLKEDGTAGELTNLINDYNVDYCVYGHVHSLTENYKAVDCHVGKTRFVLASTDWLKMDPIKICEFTQPE